MALRTNRKATSKSGDSERLSPLSIAMTDPHTKVALQQYAEDSSSILKMTKSAFWTQRVLYGTLPASSIEATLKENVCFDAAQEPKEWPALHGVRGACAEFFRQYLDDDDRQNDAYALTMLDHLIFIAQLNGLRIHTGSTNEVDPRINLSRDLLSVTDHLNRCHVRIPKEVLAIARDESSDILPILMLLRDNWTLLSTYSTAWSLMHYLIQSTDCWNEDASDRQAFFDCLESAYKTKSRWASVKERKQEVGYFEHKTRSIAIADGKTLVYPMAWKLINPADASTRCHAIRVYFGKGAEAQNVPQAVFFSKKPYSELSEMELDDIAYQAYICLDLRGYEDEPAYLYDVVPLAYPYSDSYAFIKRAEGR